MFDWIREKIIEFTIGSGRVASLIRHGLGVLSGYLLEMNLPVDPGLLANWVDSTGDLLVAAVPAVISYLLSRANKKLK